MKALQRYQQAIEALAVGRYVEGFAGYDARWEAAGIPRPALTDAAIVGREWRGSNPAGKRLLLHSEQGLGDSIQFVRFLPLVQALGAEIVLEVRPALRDLFRTLSNACQIGNGLPQGRFDLHCSLMSLPAIFETTLETVPPPAEFCLPELVCKRWRKQIRCGEGRNIGLVWAGNPEHSSDAERSTQFERLTPLLRSEKDVRFFSFQLNSEVAARQGLIDLAPQLTSFVETAAALRQMQLVITVDTAVAHLAGSLGVPTWLMLPFAASWRWMRDRTDTPWYPSMQLFRQSSPGDWDGVVQRIISCFYLP